MSNAAYRLDEADDIGKPTKPRCAAVEEVKFVIEAPVMVKTCVPITSLSLLMLSGL